METHIIKNVDYKIATLVMGWRTHKFSNKTWIDPITRGIVTKTKWHPSTDIKQAFEVVEKMREKGYHFVLSTSCSNKDYLNAYMASFNFDDGDFIEHDELHKTPATAICLASLKAMEA